MSGACFFLLRWKRLFLSLSQFFAISIKIFPLFFLFSVLSYILTITGCAVGTNGFPLPVFSNITNQIWSYKNRYKHRQLLPLRHPRRQNLRRQARVRRVELRLLAHRGRKGPGGRRGVERRWVLVFEVTLFSEVLTLSLSCQDDGSRKPDMKLAVPDILKVQLVDDWEAVTKNGQVRLT